MNVAIPRLNKIIAPCFEAAKCIEIFNVSNGIISSRKSIQCTPSDAIFRTKLFQLYDIETLICNGIKNFNLYQLKSANILVISKVNAPVEIAINLFIRGKLNSYSSNEQISEIDNLISHQELVDWARDLFTQSGYTVEPYTEDESALIDLIAKIECPGCRKKIRAAICCGAQTYRADQEIREFHHSSKSQYDARVYVYKSDPRLEKCCTDYGIEFLSPDKPCSKKAMCRKSAIPILRIPIEGHTKAFC